MIKFKITNDKMIMKSVDPNLCTLGQAELDCHYDGTENRDWFQRSVPLQYPPKYVEA